MIFVTILGNCKESMSPSSGSEICFARIRTILTAPSASSPSSCKELSSSFAIKISSWNMSKNLFLSSSFNFSCILCIFSAKSLIFSCSIFVFLLLLSAELFSLLKNWLLILLIFALKRLYFINFLWNIP